MQRNVLLGGVKQIRHVKLGQPNRLLLRPQLDLAAPVFGGVKDQFTHAEAGGVKCCDSDASSCNLNFRPRPSAGDDQEG